MRLVFFGPSEFAVPTLERLAADGNVLPLVVTNPARPAGRGRRLQPSPVVAAARRLGMTVTCPVTPNDHGFVEQLRAAAPDIGVLVAYGGILHDDVLKVPRLGFINLHPSLLPRYRGAAPIQWAIFHGETETGITVQMINERLDILDEAEFLRLLGRTGRA